MSEARSLRGSIRRLALVAVGVALVGLALSAASFLRLLDGRGDLDDRVNPAQLALERHLTALVDQETGLRAYLVTRDPRFLTPFQLGLETEQAEAADLRELLADGSFEPVQAAADEWHRVFADPTLAAAPTPAEAERLLVEGRVALDRVRSTTDDLRAALAVEDRDARDRLDSTTIQLVATLAIVGAGFAAAAAVVWRVFEGRVEEPLLALGDDAEVVSRGYLDHAVTAVGPAEFVTLARAMEAMRLRILEEVATVETARALLEEQAADLGRSNAELEQFAYVASHDLQEPLRKISSFCQLLQQRYGGQLDERADQYIHFAVDGAKRMQDLINDLLAFSRVGRIGGDPEPTDLDHLLDRALDNLGTIIEETGATIAREPLPEVVGDPNLLAALFQNLVGNAVKFAREGVPPEVRITAAEADGAVEVVVVDNGIGIDAEYAERIFVIFQRLHGREAYEGTGIGLSLCRKIVEHHGGRIWVDTSVTEGAAIRFTLPLPVPDDEPNDPPVDPQDMAHDPEGNPP